MTNLPIKLQEMLETRPVLKEKAAKLSREHGNYHLEKYKLLAELLEENYVEVSKKTAIVMYYGIENEKYLTEVDFVIANLIFSLQNNRKENVFLGYESNIKLGSNEPEYEYLVNLVAEVVEKEMQKNLIQDIVRSHLECDLTEENGWTPEVIAFLEKVANEDFDITFKSKE